MTTDYYTIADGIAGDIAAGKVALTSSARSRIDVGSVRSPCSVPSNRRC